jgi:acetylornithine/succinyldiaminopimelate/putrescine aminotransferase
MTFDLERILRSTPMRDSDLHAEHVNPAFVRMLRTIGFDRSYVRGEGAYLWDDAGQKYLDMLGGYAVFNAGRNHPVLVDAVRQYLDLGEAALVQMHAPRLAGLLAARLKSLINGAGRPALDRVYFSNSGAEGIETAIKFARRHTTKPVIVSCDRSFHGLTTGALALNGGAFFRDGFEPHDPHVRRIPFGDPAALEHALASNDVAAFIVEPVQGKGVIIPPAGYLAEACAMCHRYGALFVADEIQTGFGRTGRLLAIDHETGVEPDMIVLSKALSGGLVPVGAVMCRREVHESVFSSMDQSVVHSSTFGQGGLAMAVGLASLHVIETENLAGRADALGAMLGDGLRAMVPRFEFLHDVRQRGLMIGIELGPPKSLVLRGAWTMARALDKNLMPQAVTMPLLDDHRILTQVAGYGQDVIKLIPPLVISEEDVRWFIESFEQVMVRLHQFPGPAWEVIRKVGKHALSNRRSARAGSPVPS